MPNAAGDQYRSYVVLHVHADGSNGSTTLSDSSASAHTFTANGNAQLSTSRPKFGTAAMEFDGAGDYFQTANSSDFTFGSGNFVIEGQAQTDTVTGIKALIGYANGSAANSNYEFQLIQNGTSLEFSAFIGAAQYTAKCTGVLSIGSTYCWAFERFGDTLYAYFNGTKGGTTATLPAGGALNNPSASVLQIGRVQGSFDFDGMIDELRITKGIARYQGANYTAPTAAFPDVGLVATGATSTFAAGTPVLVTPSDQTCSATGAASTFAAGTPIASWDQFCSATGAAPTFAAGTPFAVFNQICSATGAVSAFSAGTPIGKIVSTATGANTTAYGTPRIYPYGAAGARTTLYGLPTLTFTAVGAASTFAAGTPVLKHIALGVASTFVAPMAFYPFLQACAAEGKCTTQYGFTTVIAQSSGPTNFACGAQGAKTTQYGKPSVHLSSAYQVSAASTTVYGTPMARPSFAAGAYSVTTAYGAPTVRALQRASGVRSTATGQPTVKLVLQATGRASTARCGTPSRGGMHVVWPVNKSTRCGHPRAWQGAMCVATSISTTAYGTPVAHDIHRVARYVRSTARGKATLLRSPVC